MRMTKTMITAAGIALLLPLAGNSMASEDEAYGHGRDLMSGRELAEHRATMRRLSPEEREAYRAAHHEVMKERAAARGVSLPDEPLARGQGRRFAAGGSPPCPRDGSGYRHHGGRYIDD